MEPPDSDSSKPVPPCPVCGAVIEQVYSRFGESVYVCIECHTGITVPRKAWDVAEFKKIRRQDKPDEKVG